jgi:thioredoxin reductase (NADPH)
MTVDDDPGVSRSVARDLRRRYGQDYRIVRAESGRDALDALRELVLRGEPVAAILADYRMPEMNGIEFLEQAMDVAPHARRALLTAYADTDAAIQAINVVDVDHYLLKPWDPRRRSSTRWWTRSWRPGARSGSGRSTRSG